MFYLLRTRMPLVLRFFSCFTGIPAPVSARSTLVVATSASMCLGMAVAKGSAADVFVGEKTTVAELVPLAAIEHNVWDQLLKEYVDRQGMVRYAAWKKNADDVRALDGYLRRLSHSNGEGSRDEKLAFWINAYNAVTIKGILREYPTSSIRNHTARFFGYNIWKNLKLHVGDQAFSLEAIEHEILRKMGEPRIHFAIVCASISCPRLLDEAYVAERIQDQLNNNAREFFADSSKFQYDSARRTFSVSPILSWFGEDFGNSTSGRLKRISDWLPEGAARAAAARGEGKITFLEYDWGLNDRK